MTPCCIILKQEDWEEENALIPGSFYIFNFFLKYLLIHFSLFYLILLQTSLPCEQILEDVEIPLAIDDDLVGIHMDINIDDEDIPSVLHAQDEQVGYYKVFTSSKSRLAP